jgi:hypothetical protein
MEKSPASLRTPILKKMVPKSMAPGKIENFDSLVRLPPATNLPFFACTAPRS